MPARPRPGFDHTRTMPAPQQRGLISRIVCLEAGCHLSRTSGSGAISPGRHEPPDEARTFEYRRAREGPVVGAAGSEASVDSPYSIGSRTMSDLPGVHEATIDAMVGNAGRATLPFL